jgi:hypothetical protein
MADEYLSLIKPVAQRRPILLGGAPPPPALRHLLAGWRVGVAEKSILLTFGHSRTGWSLGGLVALEMARIAADNPLDNPPIVGLVLIDSTFPHPLGLAPDVKRVPYEVDFDEHVKPEIKAMVQHCMAQTDQLIGSWHPPSWESSTAAAAAQGSNAAGDSEPDGSVGTKLLPPPAILLRAREPVPEPPCQPGVRNVTDIDLARDRRFLGWEDYQFKFLRNVLDVNGHHHNIFDQKNVSMVFYF